jgi:hypothetical protein
VVDTTMDGLEWVRKQVERADTDLLREMVKLFCERVMGEEVDAICGASYGERSDDRTNRRNGYRSRPWDTRTGDDRPCRSEAARGQLLSRLAPGAPSPPSRRSYSGRRVLRPGRLTRRVEGLRERSGSSDLKSRVSQMARSSITG